MELTTSGYLYLSADLAATRFPNDALLATFDGGDLILWQARGASAGGLLLKQRNLAGDRCVLVRDLIPPSITAGRKEAFWDDALFNLRVVLSTAVAANALVQEENGRWVVYLEVGFWEDGEGSPLKVTRSRINDYPTRRDAEVAASWIQRSAERTRKFD